MKAKFVALMAVLLVAGCGTSPVVTGTTAPKAQVAARSVPASHGADLKTAQVEIKGAYARIQGPGSVMKGGYATLWLDVWSTDKRVKSYEAQWYAQEGMLTRFYTVNSSSNGWWAPFNPIFSNSQIQARVRVTFDDNTSASGTVYTNIWVH